MKTSFQQATIEKQANVYFAGKVNSRTIQTADGQRVTLGFMQPGEYTFETSAAELIEVLNGEMTVKLPDNSAWVTYTTGDSFNVPADSSFDLKITSFADYCCSYL